MLDNNQNDENQNLDENNNQENNQNDNQDRKRSMMGRMSGNIKSKAKGKIKAKMAAWFTKTFIIFVMKVLPIFLAICFAYTAFSWVADLVESAKNPSDVYDEMGISDLSDLMCIAGNADDGYYLAYKQGIDDKLDVIVKDYNKGSRQYVDKDTVKKMLQAELYTQFPNLGGKIGKEADVEIGDNGNSSGSADFAGTLHWPTEANQTTISSGFGPRNSPTAGASSNHGGIDIAVGEGTNVYACMDGKVTVSQYSDSAGNYVQIDHGNGYVTKYMHNSQLKVSVGDKVTAGQLIALSGNTGISTGAHLHFQIEKNGEKVDPLSFKYDNGMGNGSTSSSDSSTDDSKDSTTNNSNSKTENVMDIPKMYQNGANVTFHAHAGAEFSSTGCGLACVAMVMSYLTGSDVSFQDVVDWADDVKYGSKYFNGEGSNGPLFADSAKHWNVGEVTKTKDIDKVKQSLLDGKPVISLQKTGKFAVYRHFIVLRGVNSEGKIEVNNPNKDKSEGAFTADEIEETNLDYYIFENGTPTSKGSSTSKLIIGNDTGEGEKGFQGAIRIRRVTPNKSIGSVVNTGIDKSDEDEVVSGARGTKEKIPEKIKKQMENVSMQNISGTKYDDLSYLTIPYYDFEGNTKQGHMVVNAKLADEVLLIFEELYKIKYPIEKMDIIDNYTGSENKTGSKLDYASIDANNTSAFNDRKTVTTSGEGNTVSAHAYGQAIDINPQINPYINSDGSCAHKNAKKYTKNRDTKEGWSDTEKAACITKDSRIYKIFEKYGWTWLGKSDNTGDTQHFEKTDMTNVKTIDESSDESDSSVSSSSSSSSSNSNIQTEVKNYLESAASGTWSVYAKDLKGGKDIASVNADGKMQSASVIKLFIMATAYDEISKGKLDESSVTSDISIMITNSNNNATNRLIDKLGFDTINTYIKNNGYANTVLNRRMLASTANGDNYTSSKDAAKILENIYNGKCVNKAYSEKMLNFLKQQTRTQKIPAGVPDGVQTANKTGELDTVENDAAIVFKGDTPYVLVVMSSGLSDTSKARQDIVSISKIVYGDGAGDSSSNQQVSSKVNSKVYDLKFIPEEDFNKLVDNDDQEALKYFTLDKDWKLITATWNYSSGDGGITINKNSPISYKTVVSKYTTPFEYLMDYYVDIKDSDFITDFTDIIFDSELILAVQDNVSTTETRNDVSIVYDDGVSGGGTSSVNVTESVSTKLELTYVDTWFVKFSKDSSYTVASFNSTTGGLTGSEGELVGNYRTTSYCYFCNDDGNGNFGTSITASGRPAQTHRTVAIHASGDPGGLKLGDQIMLEGDPTVYVVEDTGGGQPGNWIDVYVDPTSSSRGSCCINSEYADKHVNVYRANNVKASSDNTTASTNKGDAKSLIDTVANVAGKVTDATTVSATSQPGPTREIYDRESRGTISIGSTEYDTTTIRSLSVSYDSGDSEITGNEEKFIKLFEDNKAAKSALKPKWLLTNIAKGQKTAAFLDLTKYLLYKLTGDNYGITSFDFSIYEPDDFTSTSRGGGYDQFIRWLHAWEGINGSISADGTKYIIGDDGYGHPTVGYGIDIFNGGFADKFRAAGYSTSVGAEVDKDFVDNLEKEEINSALQTVESKCSGLNLTQYQKYALVSRIFNCGSSGAFTVRNGKDFVSACSSYWNQDTDLEYKVPANDGMFSHPLYTNYMYAPNTAKGSGFSQGLENRRKAEWLLFKTGYYDRIDEYYEEGSGGNIVEAAATVHDYVSSNGYYYSQGGDLPGNISGVKNTRAICCATFVSWTLYESGYDWMEECPNINYCGELLPFLESKGGTKIMNPTMDKLQAGDIVFYGGGGSAHTDIYVGDGLWYNCGSNDSVRRKDAYAKGLRGDAYCIIRFEK